MRKRSLNSARVRFLKIDYDGIINYLKNYAKDALRKGAKLIILYGSLARGDYTATSDADILIVGEVLEAYVKPGAMKRGIYDPRVAKVLMHLGGVGYITISDEIITP